MSEHELRNLYSNEVLSFCLFDLPTVNNANFEREQSGKAINIDPLVNFANKVASSPLSSNPYFLHLAMTLVLSSAERYEEGAIEKRMRTGFNHTKQLGDSLGLPPCLLTATYYLNNPLRLSFTGKDGELSFIDIAKRVTGEVGSVNYSLMYFGDNIDMDIDILECAKQRLDAVRSMYLEFYGKLDPMFFARELRGYSKTFTVDGVTYPSKSIATNAEDMKLNLNLGWPEDGYIEHIQSRWAGLAGQDRDGIKDAMQRLKEGRSIQDRVAHLLGYQDDRFVADNEDKRRLARAYVALMKQNGLNASSHRSLITNFIDRPHEKAEKQGQPISVIQGRYGELGLGGLRLPQVEEFRLARYKNNRFVRDLEGALE